MATAFELLEAYVSIGERGSSQVIAQLARVEAAAIRATARPIQITVTTNAQQALSGLGSVAPQIASLQAQLGRMSTELVTMSQAATTAQASMARMAQSATATSTALARAQGSAGGFGTTVLGLGKSLATLAAIGSAAQFISSSFQEAFNRERTFVTFEAILKDGGKARDLMQEISDLSQRVPFPIAQLRATAQQLLALGSGAENVVEELQMISDVAAGSGAAIERISRVYTQVRSKQRLYAEELQQFGDAGVPILQELAANLGITTEEVRKLAEEGKLRFPEVEAAFRSLTSEGGKFANLTEKIGQTLPGTFQRFRNEVVGLGGDLASLTLGQFGEELEGAIELTKALRAAMFGVKVELEGVVKASAGLDSFQFQTLFGALGEAVRFREEMERLSANAAQPLAGGVFDEAVAKSEQAFDALRGSIDAVGAAIRGLPAVQLVENIVGDVSKLGDFNDFLSMINRGLASLSDPDRSLASDLRESLLNPVEEFEKRLTEMQRLFAKGFIDDEFLGRGIQDAVSDLDALFDKQARLRRELENTAFDIGTKEGLTLVLKQTEDQKKTTALQGRQVRLQETANALLQNIMQGVEKLNTKPDTPQQAAQETELF